VQIALLLGRFDARLGERDRRRQRRPSLHELRQSDFGSIPPTDGQSMAERRVEVFGGSRDGCRAPPGREGGTGPVRGGRRAHAWMRAHECDAGGMSGSAAGGEAERVQAKAALCGGRPEGPGARWRVRPPASRRYRRGIRRKRAARCSTRTAGSTLSWVPSDAAGYAASGSAE
jgi:hypothetical protein